MEQVRRRLTYANVVSSVALFVALGGATAFAVQQLPPRSIGAKQLRPGAVTKDKLRRDSVTAPKIKALAVKTGKLANGGVKTAKLGNAAVTTEKLRDGAVTNGKIGSDAVTGDKVVESTLAQVPSADQANFATAAGSANPVVFARVTDEGTVDVSNSKGIAGANVSTPETGVYCIAVPAFNPKGGQATARTEGEKEAIAQLRVGSGSCVLPQVEVRTWVFNPGELKFNPAKNGFYVVLYQ